MFIACKYEEIYPPLVTDFVYITDKAYTKDEVLEMERIILSRLSFEIAEFQSPYRFLEKMINIAEKEEDILILNVALYILELSLISTRTLKYT